jgi:DNA polymerase V
MKTIFALIDCDNFFVSCERIFRPSLQGRPVVVLSSNDGCVVSRSNEAKALDIPMGAPAFKYSALFKQQGVVQFSANFELYGDISERITKTLTSITPRTEVYSVDESFLDLSTLEIDNHADWARQVRQRLLKNIGVPVSIGIAQSKTLAKLASERAKKDPTLNGVLDLNSLPEEDFKLYLGRTPIKDVWGIGRRLEPKLKAEGLYSALDLAGIRPQLGQQLMGIHGRQLIAELNGQACHPLEKFGRIRQSVMKGRMFGADSSDFPVIESAIASLGARAAFSLRREGLLAKQVYIALSSDRHKLDYQRQQISIKLTAPTADTGFITSALVSAVQKQFNPKLKYHRANITLTELIGEVDIQTDIFGEIDMKRHEANTERLSAIDAINSRYGNQTIYYAAENLSKDWQPRKRLSSPRYTTNWQELPVVKSKPRPN